MSWGLGGLCAILLALELAGFVHRMKIAGEVREALSAMSEGCKNLSFWDENAKQAEECVAGEESLKKQLTEMQRYYEGIASLMSYDGLAEKKGGAGSAD